VFGIKGMYRKQIKMYGNKRRYVVSIDPENRWVKLSEAMPWDKIEEHYIQHMSEDNGLGAISSRIAFGSLYAKETLNLTDAEVVEQISENPYLQYFMGLEEYQSRPLFDSSMMVYFRRRFKPEFIAQVNEYICTGKWSGDDDDHSVQNPDELPPDGVAQARQAHTAHTGRNVCSV